MATSSIRCPACGAADPSSADNAGVHACVYCGSRYRMNLQGQAHILPVVKPPSENKAVVLVAAMSIAFILAGAIGALFVLRATDDDGGGVSIPEIDFDLPTPKALEAPPENPRVALTPADEPTPEPEPDATATFTEHHRKRSGGALWIYGMVENTSPFIVDRVEVIAVLKDAAGEEVGTKSGYIERDVLAVGATSPVTILMQDKDTPEFASIAWELDLDKASYIPKKVAGLRIEATSPTKNSWGAFECEGKVHNDGEQPARFVKVELQGWSADDKLLGLGDAYAKGEVLQPGESARFKHVGVQFDQEPARFELYVEGALAN